MHQQGLTKYNTLTSTVSNVVVEKKMYKLFTVLFVCFASISMNAQQRKISHVDTSGTWYHVYDTNGKKITTLANQSVGELIGWSSEIIVTKSGVWYKIIDPQGKTLKTMAEQTVGQVISVADNTFTSRSGNWLHTWDKTGKKLSSRPAQ